MNLRAKVVLYIVLIHLLFAVVALRVLWEDRAWLFVLEGIFALSIIVSISSGVLDRVRNLSYDESLSGAPG